MAKIKSIEYFRVKPRWLFVKVTDEDGNFGWGEGTLEGHSLAVEGALDEIITRIVGFEAECVSQTESPSPRFPSLTLSTATLSTFGNLSGDWDSTEEARSSCPPCQALTLPCGI
jgi:L-alanine-DL-glutamate epimerase-like enolase superfamily enzyme